LAIPEHRKCVQMHKRLRESYKESCSMRIRQFPKGKRNKGKIKAWYRIRIRQILKAEYRNYISSALKTFGVSSLREFMRAIGRKGKYYKYGKYDD